MNSSKLKGYLTGLIIGDGHIDSGVTRRAFVIKNINKDFIEKIKSDLDACTNFEICVKYIPMCEKDGVNHKEHWVLRISAHPYFAKKYHHFYDDNKKRRISKESSTWFNDATLANWYMSDGYICLVGKTKGNIKSRRVDICTDRYNQATIDRLINILFNKFNIKSNKIKRGNKYRIRILKESYETFFNFIYPYIVDSMKYKLYLGYEFQPEWMSDEMWNLQESLKSAVAITSKVDG